MGIVRRTYEWLNARLGIDRDISVAGKAFPAEDSFLLGEVALFCFFVLGLTGMFLGFFYQPSTTTVVYEGSVAQYQGEEIPQSFVSVLHITYDIPYGMFIRRLHHWAAHLFVASLGLHMLRVFFTGSYRNPREPNWLVGTGLAILSIFAAYTGYALPFDEFATTATGIGYSIARSIPVVGDTFADIVFGGSFPAQATIPRFYFIHVFLLPVAIAGLIALHLAILVRQKHTETPREAEIAAEESGQSVERDDDSVVVGLPAFPNQAAISAVLFFLTLGILSLLSGFLPVHNVAEYGPPDPAETPSLIMPDWFLMWIFGFLKVIPDWLSFTIPGTGVHVSTEFVGGIVLPGIVFGVLALWPFIDSRDEPRHFTADPIARPWQTGVGVAGVVFVMIASIAGMNTIAADVTGVPVGTLNVVLRWAIVLGPLLAGAITYVVLGRGDATDGPAFDGTDTDEGVDPGSADRTAAATADRDGDDGPNGGEGDESRTNRGDDGG